MKEDTLSAPADDSFFGASTATAPEVIASTEAATAASVFYFGAAPYLSVII